MTSASVRLTIEERALFTPDAPAVIDAGAHTFTWHELNARANRLADRLCELGAGPGAPVGLRGTSRAAVVVGWLAAAKADAPVVPLGSVPQSDEDRVLSATGARIVLCAGGPDAPARCTTVSINLAGPSPSTPNLAARSRPEHPAFIVAGPGGVVRTSQRELSELVRWKVRSLDASATSRVTIILAPDSPAGLREIAATLAVGGTICLPPANMVPGVPLWEFLQASETTRLYIPSDALEEVAAAAQERNGALTHLRDLIIVGGTLRLTPCLMLLLARHAVCRVHLMHHSPDMVAVGACTLELPFAAMAANPRTRTSTTEHGEGKLVETGGFSARMTTPTIG